MHIFDIPKQVYILLGSGCVRRCTVCMCPIYYYVLFLISLGGVYVRSWLCAMMAIFSNTDYYVIV